MTNSLQTVTTSGGTTSAVVAPLRKGEITQVSRAGNWVTIFLDTPISINADRRTTIWDRLAVAWDILLLGYHDTPRQRCQLVLHHTVASELNDLLIEKIYYTEDGEYKGEQFNYRD